MISNEVVSKAFKARLAILIEMSGKTQAENAAAIGIAAQNLSNFLNQGNERMPRADMLMRISDHYKVSVDWLLGRAEGKTPNAESINRLLGLSNDAILNLEHYNTGFVSPAERAIPVILNALLETEMGCSLLRRIAVYALSDFSAVYDNDHAGMPIQNLSFRAVGSTESRSTSFPISAEEMADAFVLKIQSEIKGFREAAQSGGYKIPHLFDMLRTIKKAPETEE